MFASFEHWENAGPGKSLPGAHARMKRVNSGKQRMKSGKLRTRNGKLRTRNGKQRMKKAVRIYGTSLMNRLYGRSPSTNSVIDMPNRSTTAIRTRSTLARMAIFFPRS